MPMTEDQMSDPHTRLAQARFEKELIDSKKGNYSDDYVGVLWLLGAMGLFAFISAVLIVGSFLSVVGFIFAVIFSAGRFRLIRDALVVTIILTIAIVLMATASVVANLVEVADVLSYVGKVATFTDDGTKGIGALMIFLEDRRSSLYAFMNYQQTAIFFLAVPFVVSLYRNSEQLRLALRGFDEFLGSFGDEYDGVRRTAGLHNPAPTLQTVAQPTAKETIDFGEVGYDRQPETPHDFDADDTDLKTKFRRALNATTKQHSPDLDPSKSGQVAEILHHEFGANASGFCFQALLDLSDQQASYEMKDFLLAVCSAVVKISAERSALKAG